MIRILNSSLLYILVCVLSGVTAIPLLAILGEVLLRVGNNWDGRFSPKLLRMPIRR